MPQYRKKPVVIDAFLWSGQPGPMPDWLLTACRGNATVLICSNGGDLPAYAEIKTLEGTMRANPGDWIIRGVQGELYPCKPDIFEATYEPLN